MLYPVTPCPAPRQSRRDTFKPRPCVLRYRAFKDRVRELGIEVQNGDEITFLIPMPASWSQKKRERMNLTPHTQKKDLDNLLKALLDAIYEDDAHIWYLGRLQKRWIDGAGAIRIERNYG